MPSALDDTPAIDDADQICTLDRRQPVRDDQGRPPANQRAQGSLHLAFGLAVEGRSRLVQQQDRCILEHRPGDRQALALATGQAHPVLADLRVVAVRQLADEIVGAGGARRRLDIGHRSAEPAIGDVGPQSVVEQRDLLGDECHRTAQRSQGHAANILPVYRDAAFLDVEKAGDQVENRRFAGPRGADQRDRASSRDGQRDVVKSNGAGSVTEANPVEADFAAGHV